MLNIEKQIAYWRNGAREDLDVARELLEKKRIRHGLFIAHLALEKLLKAHVCRHTKDLAPKIHNLVRLAELSGLTLEKKQVEFLAEMNEFNIEGRYPRVSGIKLTPTEVKAYIQNTEEMFQWLMNQL